MMLREQRRADAAGRAEPAALVREEVGEVASDLEHVAALVEDHEGAGRSAGPRRRCAGRTRSASMQVPDGPLICTAWASSAPQSCEHLPHASRRRGTRRCRAARSRRRPTGAWCPPTCAVPMPRYQSPPFSAISAAAAEGLDVVDRGRLLQVAVGHGVGRPVARDAALALERLDQRRLLAADVGARAEMDLDVEVEAGLAADRPRPSRPSRAAPRQRRLAAAPRRCSYSPRR